MSDRSTVIYLHDGSLEGFLTAVFDAYAIKPPPAGIAAERGYQQAFGDTPVFVATDFHKAERVRKGIVQKLGGQCYDHIYAAYLSDHADRDMIVLRYLIYVLKHGRAALSHLAVPVVAAFEDMLQKVYKEQSRMIQFLRFMEVEGGVYYAKINPKAAVMPLIMDHFAQRMNIQPFVIYDELHREAGIYDLKGWYITPVPDGAAPPEKSAAERDWNQLWKRFYDTIAIPERINLSLRRNHLPMRLWRNMIEFTEQAKALSDALPAPAVATAAGPGTDQPLLSGG